MKNKLLTLLFILFPIGLYAQNYEQQGDELFAHAQYEQAEKKYKAAIVIVGESQNLTQKQAKCTKCKNLLMKAQTAEKESRYNDAAKHYSDLYSIHPLASYQTKANALKQKSKTKGYIREGAKTIGAKAYYFRTDIKHIVIPEGVTSIGDFAFYGCTNLTSIEIPNSVTSIGDYAFEDCSSLTSLKLPNNITTIGYQTFYNCESLTSIEIPNSVTSIGGLAFYGCTSLQSVTIPNSVISIEGSAFSFCRSLSSVTIPNSVTSIGYQAFENVLNIVYFGSATGSPWGSRSINGYLDGYLVYSDNTKTTLISCSTSAIGEITIPNSVSVIKRKAFSDCKSLTSVKIPSSVTTIGDYAFSGCGLTSITIPNSVTSLGEGAFFRCSNLHHIKLPGRFKSKDVGQSYCKSITYY